jgi:hypothetical protein
MKKKKGYSFWFLVAILPLIYVLMVLKIAVTIPVMVIAKCHTMIKNIE